MQVGSLVVLVKEFCPEALIAMRFNNMTPPVKGEIYTVETLFEGEFSNGKDVAITLVETGPLALRAYMFAEIQSPNEVDVTVLIENWEYVEI